jgi:hypothetical protein
MFRVFLIALVVTFVGVVTYDTHLVLVRFSSGGSQALNVWKIAAALALQLAAVAGAAGYAYFLNLRSNTSSQRGFLASDSLRLLPFVLPAVLLMASVTLLEIGLLCGDSPFPSVRGQPVCPSR